MSRFSLFKKILPVTIMALTPSAFANDLGSKECRNLEAGFALEFDDMTFEFDSKIAFFELAKINGVEYSNGRVMGAGKITKTTADLELSFTRTGYDEKETIGHLKGKKVNGQWQLSITAWNTETKKFEAKAVLLKSCMNK